MSSVKRHRDDFEYEDCEKRFEDIFGVVVLSENDVQSMIQQIMKFNGHIFRDIKEKTSLFLRETHDGICHPYIPRILEAIKDRIIADQYIQEMRSGERVEIPSSSPIIVKKILDELFSNPTVIMENIYFQDRDLNHQISRMSSYLSRNQTLKSLTLIRCNLDDQDAKVIASGLKQNNTLTSLDLSHNHIGDEGAHFIVEALFTNRSLQKLKIWGETFSDDILLRFAEMLKVNHTIITLNMAYGRYFAMIIDLLYENEEYQKTQKKLRPLATLIENDAEYQNKDEEIRVDAWRDVLGRTLPYL